MIGRVIQLRGLPPLKRVRQGHTQMMRGRRAAPRVKPTIVDGFKFASRPEADRYLALKAHGGDAFTATPSTDGRLLVCEFFRVQGTRLQKMTQAFTLAQAGPNKYRAKKTIVDGITFDSGREAARYVQLTHMQAAGEIDELKYHPDPFDLVVNGVRIGRYTPDFTYRIVATGARVVEDSKSAATRKARDYPLRKKLMLACHGIEIAET